MIKSLKIKSCPLCMSKKAFKKIYNINNVYSSFLSKIFSIDEKKINKYFYNVECFKCGLIYKKKWISKNVKKLIYDKNLVLHPTGNAILSQSFSIINFVTKIENFLKLKKNFDLEKFKQLERELSSLVNSIDNNKDSFIKKRFSFIKNIKYKNYSYLKKNKKYFYNNFTFPKKFSKYSGYNDYETLNYIKKNVGNLNIYGEIGCPSWGFLNASRQNIKKRYFIRVKNQNFWNCSKTRKIIGNKSENCFIKAKRKYKFASLNFEKLNNKHFDFIGIYNYLDHLEKPKHFLKILVRKTKSIGLIVKDVKKSKTDIQHFTTWTKKSIVYLSKMYNFKLTKPTLKLSDTGYNFYIMNKNISNV
jgi:hypothetical protein